MWPDASSSASLIHDHDGSLEHGRQNSGKQFDAARARRWLEHVQGQHRVLLQSSSSLHPQMANHKFEATRAEQV
jgi:hypothetical protein